MSEMTIGMFAAMSRAEQVEYLDTHSHAFLFEGAPATPQYPSRLGAQAPIRLDMATIDWGRNYTDAEWAVLFSLFYDEDDWNTYWASAHDHGPFVRWSARAAAALLAAAQKETA